MVTNRRLKKIHEVEKNRFKDFYVVLENISKAHNFSAVLRTVDAVGATAVYTNKPLKTLSVTAKGTERWVDVRFEENIYEFLINKKNEGYQIVVTALSEESVDFRKVDWTKPTFLVMGNELNGVSDKMLSIATKKIHIPQYGMVQSLNISVATAIILYEVDRQRRYLKLNET